MGGLGDGVLAVAAAIDIDECSLAVSHRHGDVYGAVDGKAVVVVAAIDGTAHGGVVAEVVYGGAGHVARLGGFESLAAA